MSNNKKENALKGIKRYIENFGYYEFFIFVLFIILAGIICITHELSQDEAQSFLIAKNLNYLDIIKQMKYEGHSFLWHFLISPIAKTNLYPDIQKIIPYTFGVITVFLILKKSPFGKITKTLLVFSPGILYYYSSFARPYCMIPFFLVYLAILNKDRYKHPYKYLICLGLLANTHMIMLPVVFILGLKYYVPILFKYKNNGMINENKKDLIISSLIFSILVIIVIIITLLGYFNCHILDVSVMYKDNNDLYKNIFKLIYESIDRIVATFYGYARRPIELTGSAPKYYYILFIIWFVLLIVSTLKSKKMSSVFWMELFFIIIVHALFWFILPIRVHLITLVLMYWAWIYYDENKKENSKLLIITLSMLILLSIPGSYKLIYEDLNKNYSSAIETSDYIKKNIKRNSTFIVLNYDFSQLLSLYLGDDYKFYYPNSKRYQTFISWDEKSYKHMDTDMLSNFISKEKNKNGRAYILIPKISKQKNNLSKQVEILCNCKLKRIYKSNPKSMINERYILDRVLFDIYEVI